MIQDWSIQSRSEHCSATGTPFTEGESFHTLLFLEGATLRREDLSQNAFRERPADAPKPFSVWRSKFEPSASKPPEALGKQTAEELLRHYMADEDPKLANVRYILAVMLERKRILKEIQTVRGEDGSLSRVYQFPKTGEVLVVPDPQLRLDQIAEVQAEVAELLGKPATQAEAPPPDPEAAPAEPSAAPEGDAPADETHANGAAEGESTSDQQPASSEPLAPEEESGPETPNEPSTAPAPSAPAETGEPPESQSPG
jgi:hypothetical protein